MKLFLLHTPLASLRLGIHLHRQRDEIVRNANHQSQDNAGSETWRVDTPDHAQKRRSPRHVPRRRFKPCGQDVVRGTLLTSRTVARLDGPCRAAAGAQSIKVNRFTMLRISKKAFEPFDVSLVSSPFHGHDANQERSGRDREIGKE